MRQLKRQLPNLNALVCFEASGRYLSFTRAADELCVTQGAVSRQVRELDMDEVRKELAEAGADSSSS